jgi:mRNA-degrading endonuclease RelE of RelBE toxin-antitoxin system
MKVNRFYPYVLITVVISVLLFNMSIPGYVSAFGEREGTAQYFAQTSLDSHYRSKMPVPKAVVKAIKKGEWVEISHPVPPTDVYIKLDKDNQYAIDHQMNIYDLKENRAILELPDKVIHQLTKDLKKLYRIHYGDLITWNEANSALPRYSSFTVLDLDTGRTFEVQRRAGSYHADVQPLTNEDTKIMKEIYRGTWSWDRRAILILSQDHKYAASMHGMPHGKGALQNGFPGHFCIHFQDSITHKSRKMDHAHSIMIKKAAGEWLDHTEKLSPAEIVDATVLSIHQHDWFILASVLDDKNRVLLKEKIKFLEEIDLVKRLSDLPADRDYDTKLYYPITVKLYIHRDTTGTESRQVTFQLYRGSIEEPWTVDLNNLIQQL